MDESIFKDLKFPLMNLFEYLPIYISPIREFSYFLGVDENERSKCITVHSSYSICSCAAVSFY